MISHRMVVQRPAEIADHARGIRRGVEREQIMAAADLAVERADQIARRKTAERLAAADEMRGEAQRNPRIRKLLDDHGHRRVLGPRLGASHSTLTFHHRQQRQP